MKKTLTLIFLSLLLFGCSKKDNTKAYTYPKTVLANTTWNTSSSAGTYEFIQFNADLTTAKIYFAHADGSQAAILGTYPVTVTLSDKNMDSFEVYQKGVIDKVGFTTENVNVIQFDNVSYNKVN